MAFTGNDIALFIFLKQVFDFKHRVENWGKKDFHGIRFDPWINKWTRDVFINKGLFQYLKIYEDRKLFELFYKDLSFKPELRFLNNPFLLKDSNEKGLPQQAHDQIKKEAAEANPAAPAQIYGTEEAKTAAEEKKATKPALIREKKEGGKEEEKAKETEEAAETMASAEEGVSKEAAQQPEPGHRMPAGLPPMPTYASAAPAPRVVADKPDQTETEKTTGAPQSKPEAVGKSSKAVEEHAVQGAPSARAGLPVDNVSKEATQPVKGIKPGGAGFQFPKPPASIMNSLQNFGSAAGRFFQRNMGKFFTVGRIGTAVSAGIGAVAGAGFGPIGSLAGAAGGGIGSFWIKSGDGARFLGKAANKGLNAFEKLSKPGLKGASGSFGSFGSKKLVWGLFLGLFFFVFFSGIIGGLSGTTPSGQAAPQAPPAGSPVPYQPGAGSGILSCPLNGVTTKTLGSKDAGGHCTPQYEAQEAPCLPGDPTGRSTAIDIRSADKAVFLPSLGGQTTDWTVDATDKIYDMGVDVGQDLVAIASYKGKSYRIRFVHLDSTFLKVGEHYADGTFVGYYRGIQNHVHITLKEDDVFKPVDLYFNLCS